MGPLQAKSQGKSTLQIGGEGGQKVEVTAAEAELARKALKKELRKNSRAKIKEANFISQM